MSHWHSPPGRQPLRQIPADKLADMIGRAINLQGERSGHRYTLTDVAGGAITVAYGIGWKRRSIVRPASDALYLRGAQPTTKGA